MSSRRHAPQPSRSGSSAGASNTDVIMVAGLKIALDHTHKHQTAGLYDGDLQVIRVTTSQPGA
jgi:hypothetical protein